MIYSLSRGISINLSEYKTPAATLLLISGSTGAPGAVVGGQQPGEAAAAPFERYNGPSLAGAGGQQRGSERHYRWPVSTGPPGAGIGGQPPIPAALLPVVPIPASDAGGVLSTQSQIPAETINYYRKILFLIDHGLFDDFLERWARKWRA